MLRELVGEAGLILWKLNQGWELSKKHFGYWKFLLKRFEDSPRPDGVPTILEVQRFMFWEGLGVSPIDYPTKVGGWKK